MISWPKVINISYTNNAAAATFRGGGGVVKVLEMRRIKSDRDVPSPLFRARTCMSPTSCASVDASIREALVGGDGSVLGPVCLK